MRSSFPGAHCAPDPLPGMSPWEVTHTIELRHPVGSGPGESDTGAEILERRGNGVTAGQPELPLLPGRARAAPELQELPGSGKIWVLVGAKNSVAAPAFQFRNPPPAVLRPPRGKTS